MSNVIDITMGYEMTKSSERECRSNCQREGKLTTRGSHVSCTEINDVYYPIDREFIMASPLPISGSIGDSEYWSIGVWERVGRKLDIGKAFHRSLQLTASVSLSFNIHLEGGNPLLLMMSTLDRLKLRSHDDRCNSFQFHREFWYIIFHID